MRQRAWCWWVRDGFKLMTWPQVESLLAVLEGDA